MEFRLTVSAVFLLLLPISLRVTTAYQHKFKDFEKCIAHNKVDGCSVPFNNSFPYRAVFKPACNRHDVCYRCGNKFDWSRNDCDMGFLYDMYYTCAMKDLMHKHNIVKRSIKSINENRKKGNGKEHSGDEKNEIKEKKAAKVEVQEAKDKGQETEGKSERSINGDSGFKDEVHKELLVKHDTAAFIRQLEATKKEVLKAIDQISEATAKGLTVRSNGKSTDSGDSQKREGNEQSKGEDQEKEVGAKVKKCDDDDDTCNWVKKDKGNGDEEYRDKEDKGKVKKKESETKDSKNEEVGGKGDADGGKREQNDSKKENNGMEERKKEDTIGKKKGAGDNDFDYREINHEKIEDAHETGLKVKVKKENKAEKKTVRNTKTKEEDNSENKVLKHDDGSKSKAKKENAATTKVEVDEDDDYREMYHDGDDISRGLKEGKSKKEEKEKGKSKIRENSEEITKRNEEMQEKGAGELQQKKMRGENKKELIKEKTDREEAQSDDDDDDGNKSKRSKIDSKHEEIKENLAKERVHESKPKAKHHEKHLKEKGSECDGSKKCGAGKHVKTHAKEEEIENKISDKKVDDMTKKYAEIERLLKELNTLIRSTKHNGHSAQHAGLGHKGGHGVHHEKNVHKSHEIIANSKDKHGEGKKGEKTNAKTEKSQGRTDVKKHKPTKGAEEAKHTIKRTHSHENKGQGIRSRPSTQAHEKSKNRLPQKVTTKKKVIKIKKGKKEKRAHIDQENLIFPIKSKYFNKCKLAAYLYYIAVRGFGQRYYRDQPPGWCEKFCVQENGVPNLKKYRRPRNIM